MPTKASKDLVVCVGFPVFQADHTMARLEALPGIEPLILPVDPDGSWASYDAAVPYLEPPPWALAHAAERARVLARTEAMISLHAPADIHRVAPELRWIQGIGAGVEQYAAAGAQRDRVVVTNAAGVSAGSMAEWVVGRLLQVWKLFRQADDYQREGRYERTYGRTFAGTTVGIVGLGNIGRETARRLKAFDCRVLGLKRSAKPGGRAEHTDALFAPAQLHEMLAQCDAVVVAAPSTPETHHLIDAAALAALPAHAVLVNVARGALVDEAALAAALAARQIGAAVLDVFEHEPLEADSPLWGLDDVYLSAHSSVATDRYLDDVFELVFENLERHVAGKPLRNVIDMEALGFETGDRAPRPR